MTRYEARCWWGLTVVLAVCCGQRAAAATDQTVRLPARVVEDKIRGGLLGQLLGNLNGLKYEFKFNDEPGNVEHYTPDLKDGARTDDDTDIEWVYIVEMSRTGQLLVPYPRIRELWLENMNQGVWVANHYASCLMHLGIEPPLTGRPAVNPKSDFNISGQFVCETFGLIAPAMPQTAARVGLHYTHVTIDGEPAQTTQLFTSMIATAFVSDDIDQILDAGLASIDPASQIHHIVTATRGWHREHPGDWRATRRLVQEHFFPYKGAGNGYGVCTASTVAALLYGKSDFAETLRLAFNFGWDADNNAATAGTILGVIKGHRWMRDQGWPVGDTYRNTTRPGMPHDETITRFGDRLVQLAELAIVQGGGKVISDGQKRYEIPAERPANIERMTDLDAQFQELREAWKSHIEADLGAADQDRQARAAYLALCFQLEDDFRQRKPAQWTQAMSQLKTRLQSKQFEPLRAKLPP